MLKQERAVKRATLFGDVIHASVTRADWGAIEGRLGAAGVTVAEVVDVEASLEDVFIDRVSGAGTAP